MIIIFEMRTVYPKHQLLQETAWVKQLAWRFLICRNCNQKILGLQMDTLKYICRYSEFVMISLTLGSEHRIQEN